MQAQRPGGIWAAAPALRLQDPRLMDEETLRCAYRGHRGQTPEAASRLPGEWSSYHFAISCVWCPLAWRPSLPAACRKQAASPRRLRARDLLSQGTADAAQITFSHRRRGSGGPLRVTAPLESPRLSLVHAQRCAAVSAPSPPVIQIVPPFLPFPRRVPFWGRGPHSLPPNTLTYVPPRSHRVVSRGRGTAHGLPAPAQGRCGIVPRPWPPGLAACGFWRLKGPTALLRFPYPRGRPRLEISPRVWRFEGGCFRLGVPRPLSPLAGCGGLQGLRSLPTPPGTAHMTRREKDMGAFTLRCFPGRRDPGGLPPPLGCRVDFRLPSGRWTSESPSLQGWPRSAPAVSRHRYLPPPRGP